MNIITDHSAPFHLAPGPWASRNSSIDTGNVEVGRRATLEVPPGVFWRSLLHLGQPQFLKFNISLGKDALFGVYIRKGLPPSHAQVKLDFCKVYIFCTVTQCLCGHDLTHIQNINKHIHINIYGRRRRPSVQRRH